MFMGMESRRRRCACIIPSSGLHLNTAKSFDRGHFGSRSGIEDTVQTTHAGLEAFIESAPPNSLRFREERAAILAISRMTVLTVISYE